MKTQTTALVFVLFLISYINIIPTHANNLYRNQIGLMIIDAQKWFIPGHPESMYELWHINEHDRSSESIISSMKTVLTWANKKELPVFVTYEAKDTGRCNLPNELLNELASSRTTKYIKFFYDATKHDEFKNQIINSKVDHWIVIGAETDVCVYQTVKGLLNLGKKVTLVNEAVYSGRNNNIVSINSLKSFGANCIGVNELNTLDNLSQKPVINKVENELKLENLVLTIYPYSDTTHLSKGNIKRLEYFKKYASIVGLKIEHFDSLSINNSKTRVLAGNISKQKYDLVKNRTGNEIVVLVDALPNLTYNELPIEWRKHTVKSLFYELMQTVNFYYINPAQLIGWQRELRNAIDTRKLDYSETLQNK